MIYKFDEYVDSLDNLMKSQKIISDEARKQFIEMLQVLGRNEGFPLPIYVSGEPDWEIDVDMRFASPEKTVSKFTDAYERGIFIPYLFAINVLSNISDLTNNRADEVCLSPKGHIIRPLKDISLSART